jgi:hypothetical protein
MSSDAEQVVVEVIEQVVPEVAKVVEEVQKVVEEVLPEVEKVLETLHVKEILDYKKLLKLLEDELKKDPLKVTEDLLSLLKDTQAGCLPCSFFKK